MIGRQRTAQINEIDGKTMNERFQDCNSLRTFVGSVCVWEAYFKVFRPTLVGIMCKLERTIPLVPNAIDGECNSRDYLG